MGEHVYKHQNNLFLIFMTPISRTSERSIDTVHVQDQTKICLYLGQDLIWQIHLYCCMCGNKESNESIFNL